MNRSLIQFTITNIVYRYIYTDRQRIRLVYNLYFSINETITHGEFYVLYFGLRSPCAPSIFRVYWTPPIYSVCPPDTRRWANVVLMLANIKTTLFQGLLSPGYTLTPVPPTHHRHIICSLWLGHFLWRSSPGCYHLSLPIVTAGWWSPLFIFT